MSSKRKSPPTKLEGGCQPTTTTTTATNNNNNITTTTATTDILHTNLANFNQKSSNLIGKDHTIAHIKRSDNEHFTKPLSTLDCDDELTADIENNDHNNNDDDASDNCDGVTANTLTSDSFDGKFVRDRDRVRISFRNKSFSIYLLQIFATATCRPDVNVLFLSVRIQCVASNLAKNVLSCIQAKLDSIKAKLNEKHLGGAAESINKFSTRKSVDERNNNSDYEEPCKRPKIDLGSSSPVYSVRQRFSYIIFQTHLIQLNTYYIY